MGLITKAVIESLTDKIVAQAQDVLSGVDTARAAWTKDSLFGIVDALEDPDLEIALGSVLHRCDTSLYPMNWSRHAYQQGTQLVIDSNAPAHAKIATRDVSALYSALRTTVTTSAGGSFDSFAAYLDHIGARLHPIFAEIVYATGDRNAFRFGDSNSSPGVFSPEYRTIAPTAAYVGTAGNWTDETVDVASAGASDFPFFDNENDCLIIGCDRPFNAVAFQMGTLSSHDCSIEFRYSRGGSDYGVLTVEDGTVGMTKNEIITFNIPLDWTMTNLDTGGNYYDDNNRAPRYYIQLKRTAETVTTSPVGTWARLVPTRVYANQPSGADANPLRLSGLVTQPPLALLRLTNVGGGSIEVINNSITVAEYGSFFFPRALKFEVLAITGGGNSNTITISYVSDSGKNETKAQSTWNMGSATAGALWPPAETYLTLETGDKGIRNANKNDWAATANTTSAILALVNVWERTPAK